VSGREIRAAFLGLVVFAVLVFFYFGTLLGFILPALSIPFVLFGGVRRV